MYANLTDFPYSTLTFRAPQNQDTLKTRPACLALLRASLTASPPRSCVIDNTNPSAATRAEYVSLVREVCPGARIRAFVFDASLEVAKHNSVYRALQTRGKNEGRRDVLPLAAFLMFEKGFEVVKPAEGKLSSLDSCWMSEADGSFPEGFDEVKHIAFKIDDEEERKRWVKWLGGVYPEPKARK